jgi:hypothetical protein
VDLPSIPHFGNPFKQHGGPVMAGHPYIVGERRPELFVPNSSGRILPRVPAGGGASTIIVPVYLDGRQIAEAVFNPLRDRAARYQRSNGRAAFG